MADYRRYYRITPAPLPGISEISVSFLNAAITYARVTWSRSMVVLARIRGKRRGWRTAYVRGWRRYGGGRKLDAGGEKREGKKTTAGKFGGIIFRLGSLVARLRRDQGKPLDQRSAACCTQLFLLFFSFFYSFLARKRCPGAARAHVDASIMKQRARGVLGSFCRQFDRRSEERKVRRLVIKALLNPRTRRGP